MSMSKRERVLAFLVGGTVFLLLNLFLLTAIARKQTSLRNELSTRRNDWASIQQLLAERDLWKQRDAWLDSKQPKLTNETTDYVQLLDQLRDLAKQHDITLENPTAGSPEKTQWYHSVSVNMETRSSWQSLIAFLQAVQTPERFMVFESANIQIDGEDATKMHGTFKIARWYAP
jgi:Tfp pilus assembly protein PilO